MALLKAFFAAFALALLVVASAPRHAASSPTQAEFMEEVAEFQKTLARKSARYGAIAAVVRRAVDRLAEDPDSDISILYNRTILVPTNRAVASSSVDVAGSLESLIDSALYIILEPFLTFKQLKAVAPGALIPTLLEGKSLKRYRVARSPRAQLRFGRGTAVALGAPGADASAWAQVDDANLFLGKFIRAHGVDGVPMP